MPAVRRRNPDLHPDPVALPWSGSAPSGQFLMPPQRNSQPPQLCSPGRAHYLFAQRPLLTTPVPIDLSVFPSSPSQQQVTADHHMPPPHRLQAKAAQIISARALTPSPTPKQNPLKIRRCPAVYFTARFPHF